ncbi:rop guanine nucleotide exchange factor 3-like isoform [Arachis hypogaea]|nr:rop guanine nucleotide exchange factor 3-like isoform [Arachis hypogaea]
MQVFVNLIINSCAKNMEKKSSSSTKFDEISELGFQPPPPSPSMEDHSATDAWTYSEPEASNLSDSVDESSYASDFSPSRPTAARADAKQVVLSRLGLKLRKNSVDVKLNESDLMDSGELEVMKERFQSCCWRRHVWWWKRSLHCSYNFKCHYQSLCNCIWTKFEVGATEA